MTRKVTARWWTWTPDIAALFAPVPEGWRAPNQVRVHPGKSHVTLRARFRTADGLVNTATIRLVRDCASGALTVVGATLTQDQAVPA